MAGSCAPGRTCLTARSHLRPTKHCHRGAWATALLLQHPAARLDQPRVSCCTKWLHEMGSHEELLTRQKNVQRLGCSASRAVRAAVCACPSTMWTACGNQTASERTTAIVTEAVQNLPLRRAYSAHLPDRLLRCASFWLRLRAVTSCSCRRLPRLLLLLLLL